MSKMPYTNQTYECRFVDFTNDLSRWQNLAKFQGEHGRMLLLEKIQERANDMAPIIARDTGPDNPPEDKETLEDVAEECANEALAETVSEMAIEPPKE